MSEIDQIKTTIKIRLAEYHHNKQYVPGISVVPVSGQGILEDDIDSLVDALLNFWYTEGRYCHKFERLLEDVTQNDYVTLCNSGSSAALLSLSAARDLGYQDVVVSVLSFPTVISAILRLGMNPIWVDINPKTLAPDMSSLSEKELLDMSDYSVFFMTHMMGFAFDEWKFIGDSLNPFLISDCCDALGAKLVSDKPVGYHASMSIYSFFPAHHISSIEGGAIATNDDGLASALKRLTGWGRECHCSPGQSNTCGHRFNVEQAYKLPDGWDHKYTFTDLGYNLKMTEFQAAMGYSQLQNLDHFVQARQDNYRQITDHLRWNFSEFLDFTDADLSKSSPFGVPITVRPMSPFTRKELVAYLERHKVTTRMFFGGNVLRQPAFRDYGDANLYPGANTLMDRGFWVGCHPGLTQPMIDYMMDMFDQFFIEKGLVNG